MAAPAQSCQRVAVVIPTLNEEAAIAGVIALIPPGVVDDVIVADSASTDRTVERARAAGARVVSESYGDKTHSHGRFLGRIGRTELSFGLPP